MSERKYLIWVYLKLTCMCVWTWWRQSSGQCLCLRPHFSWDKFMIQIILPFGLTTRRRRWHPTLVLLPGKSHGQRSLVGCSPRGREESDTIERLPFPFSLSCNGEGNGNPLQCSCLENPRDGGSWWAAVYGVTQSRTWLKWLSSSSSIYFISDTNKTNELSL